MRATRGRALALFALLTAVLIWMPRAHANDKPQVLEVTIAAPDILAVVVRDPPFIPGQIIKVPPMPGKPGDWTKHDGVWGRVIGPNRTHFRTTDTPPAAYLERTMVHVAQEYPPIGGRRVTAVYRKSVPYDAGVYRGRQGDGLNSSSFQHFIYLKLDGALPPGEHRIVWPQGVLPPTPFAYQDTLTRAIGLRVNQNGYAPSDRSKIAYLSLWLPGGPQFGAIDYHGYRLDTFEIRDAAGKSVFTGPITLRLKPTDPEPATGMPALLEYPDATAKPVKVDSVVIDKTITLIAPGHQLAGQKRAWLEGFLERLGHLHGLHDIEVDGSGHINLPNAKVNGPKWSQAELGSITPVVKTNRTSTFTYHLDFSAFTPTQEGDYHIYVPGLGVSDRFRVASDVWLSAARASFGGLYNHRSGIALDGRFGWTRPVAFRPGADFRIIQSRLPLVWSDQSSVGSLLPSGKQLSIEAGSEGHWRGDISTDPGLWGGYMDAGDWDRHIVHLDVSNGLMTLLESGGAAVREAKLSLPKSHEVLDPDLYRELADAPDILHEIAWILDFFRRLQLPDGRMRGGIESAGHPRQAEPSFLESLPVFVYAPDHVSSHSYAAAAARFSRILDGEKKPQLAAVFRKSALSAWTAGELGFHDPATFYADSVKAGEAAKEVDAKSWSDFKTTIQKRTLGFRASAAGALFRLTGEDKYRKIFEGLWRTNLPPHLPQANGAWEYMNAPKADPAFKSAIRRKFLSEARSIVDPMAKTAYASLKHPFAPAGWGQGTVPDSNIVQLLLRAHVMSPEPAFIDGMQQGSAFILGANPIGISLTTGLGRRNIRHPLHEDHRAMGVPAPSGITNYGFAPQWISAYHWVFGPFWAPLPDYDQKENGAYRRVEPNRYTLPYFEYLIEHPSLTVQQEYTVHQTIAPTAIMWLYLHAQSAGNGR